MGKTYTDFSQLSKGMFKKSDPVVEVKPQPEAGNGEPGTGNGMMCCRILVLLGTGKGERGTGNGERRKRGL